jgi:hypothetical protein
VAAVTTTGDAWPEFDALVDGLLDARARIAEQHALETTLMADALACVLARMESHRAGADRSDSEMVMRSACAELATALRVSDRTVQGRLGDAAALAENYPVTLEALREGRIERGHATAIVDAGAAIADAATRERYERLALEVAESESVPRTRAAVRALAAAVDPQAAQVAMEHARRDRSVRVYDLPDGMARLLADLPAHLAYAIHDRLTRMAHDIRTPNTDERAESTPTGDQPARPAESAGAPGSAAGASTPMRSPATDPRCIDELRADVLADLLLSATPTAHGDAETMAAIEGRVQVTVPVLTLAGVSDEPALLAGYGPIDAATARQLAAGAPGWDRVMTHPHTGLPLAVDRYRPSAELRRFLAARDEHCRFPGCRAAVWRCDLDHTVAASDGGHTSCENLAHFCRRHHTMKHACAWTVKQLPGGVLEWTSPAGRIHLDRPAPTVRFVPSEALPPSVRLAPGDAAPSTARFGPSDALPPF